MAAFVLSAWLSDDAYISFRTVDNALSGYGLTWNPIERVQAYTHPLWLFLHIAAVKVTSEYYFTSLILCFTFSWGGLWLLTRRLATSVQIASAAALALLSSKAFVDYASSGLEDPLTRLLLVLYALVLLRPMHSPVRNGASIALLAALGALCRPDAFLFFLPGLVWQAKRALDLRRLRPFAVAVIAGILPLLCWAAFAFVYYGSPFPNTATAKLAMGVPRHGLLLQSLAYITDSLTRDPFTLVLIAFAASFAWRRRNIFLAPEEDPRTTASVILVASALLYLGFVFWIGGDYMSGRMLGSPLLLAVMSLMLHPWASLRRRSQAFLALGFLLLLLIRMLSPLIIDNVGPYGVGDERRTHHPYTGLLYAGGQPWPQHSLRTRGEGARNRSGVEVSGAVGLFGFYAGPGTTIVDIFGLTDPLLARLPGIVTEEIPTANIANWRPGHAQRPVPEGYLSAVTGPTTLVADPDLAHFYAVVQHVTRGPLFSVERLGEALALLLGAYDGDIDRYVERHPQLFDRYGESQETLWGDSAFQQPADLRLHLPSTPSNHGDPHVRDD